MYINRILMLFFCFLLLPTGKAMDFSLVEWKGHQVILASGAIIQGDSLKLAEILPTAPKLPHGVPVILLSSPSGSVNEAFMMSNLMNIIKVHTVIPNSANCASACASILFIAGKYRTIEDGGLFGQHACSTNGIPNPLCNEEIAQHARKNGVSHGSVKAYLKYIEPQDISWFSRKDLDCWDISRYPYSSESGFSGKPEPCFLQTVLGKQSAGSVSGWRVDFIKNGYRAFLRPAGQYVQDGQLNLWCTNSIPSTLLLSVEIRGNAEIIKSAVKSATLSAAPINIYTNLSNSRKALIFAANHCIN